MSGFGSMPTWKPGIAPKRGSSGTSATFGGVPIQAEVSTHLGRFSYPASDTYKTALNRAVYRWKETGGWPLAQDIFLTCADVAGDSIKNLVDASRDATITGSPTFTPLRGFSGFDASNYISLPFSTTNFSTSSGVAWAGRAAISGWDYFNNGPCLLAGSALGANGSLSMDRAAGGSPGHTISNSRPLNITGVGPVGAAAGSTVVPTGSAGGGAPSTTTASPLRTNHANSGLITQIAAYAILPLATPAQVRQFLAILQTFLDEIGALD
jgi:hypothetical protein